MKQKGNDVCELCGESASVYCSADSAFLCWPCDRRVHQANFLVARHVRRLTCPACLSISGSGPGPIRPLCPSCRQPDPVSRSSSCLSSSDATSSPPPAREPVGSVATSASAKRRALGNWSRRIGGTGRTAGEAARVLRSCGGEMMPALPLRASMAAALYHASRDPAVRTCEEVLRRLERCSGVPASVIVEMESRIARAIRRRRRRRRVISAEEEEWAECS